MALFEKVINMRVARIIEAHKFDIWAVLIGDHMQARGPRKKEDRVWARFRLNPSWNRTRTLGRELM